MAITTMIHDYGSVYDCGENALDDRDCVYRDVYVRS